MAFLNVVYGIRICFNTHYVLRVPPRVDPWQRLGFGFLVVSIPVFGSVRFVPRGRLGAFRRALSTVAGPSSFTSSMFSF